MSTCQRLPIRTPLPSAYKASRIAVAVLVAATLGAPGAASQRLPEYGYTLFRNSMVPMRDGVQLAADVYLPAVDGEPAGGTYPALVTRVAYGRGDGGTASELARRGYAVVVQDVRGRFESEGEFYPYLADPQDGYDTVDWIRKQPWSNGRVGAFGSSYTANSAHALAATNPDGLQAVFAMTGGSNYWEDAAGYGGAWQPLHNLGWALGHASDEFEGLDDPPPQFTILSEAYDDLWEWLLKPVSSHRIPLSAKPDWEAFYQDWAEQTHMGTYWQQSGYYLEDSYDALSRAPLFYLGGWYDLFLKGTLINFSGVTRAGGQVQLVVGPWDHGRGRLPEPFGFHVDFGPQAQAPPVLDYQLRTPTCPSAALQALWSHLP